jgi:hypothetical protein
MERASMPLTFVYHRREYYCSASYDRATNYTTIAMIPFKQAVVLKPWKKHVCKIGGRVHHIEYLSEYISIKRYQEERKTLVHTPTGTTWRLVWKLYEDTHRIFWNIFNEKFNGGYGVTWIWHHRFLAIFVAKKHITFVTFTCIRKISCPGGKKHSTSLHGVFVQWVDKRCFVFSTPKIYNRPYAAFFYCLDWYHRNNNESLARVLPFLRPIDGYRPYKLPISERLWLLFLYKDRKYFPADYVQLEGLDLAKNVDRHITQAIIRETNKLRKHFQGCKDLRKFRLFIVRSESNDARTKYWHFKLLFYQATQKCRISERVFPTGVNRIEFTCQYPVYAADMLTN